MPSGILPIGWKMYGLRGEAMNKETIDSELEQAKLDDTTCPICGKDMQIREVDSGFAFVCECCEYEEEIDG